jgi:hypothetical protein
MLEFTTTFTPADGSAPRLITLRISDVRRESEDPDEWSALIEVLGFDVDEPDYYTKRVHGVDWMQAIELAARFIASECKQDGTFDPPIYPRDSR